jgi:hypothetical protein
VKTSNPSNGVASRTLAVLRRPFAGPILFGLLAGGIPIGMFLAHVFPSDDWSVPFIDWMTPFAVIVAFLGAILTVSRTPGRLLWRAFLTSLSACVPVPIFTYSTLAQRNGWDLYDPHNLPLVEIIFPLWALVVAVIGWLLAWAFTYVKNRAEKRREKRQGL